MRKRNLSHHATIIPVNEILMNLSFYTDQLGFECSFLWDDPPTYAVLKRDGVNLHLAKQDKPVRPGSHVIVYIFCENVEEVCHELKQKEVQIEEQLNVADYQMKEFVISDPSGHRIVFGQEI